MRLDSAPGTAQAPARSRLLVPERAGSTRLRYATGEAAPAEARQLGQAIRADFPILQRKVGERDLVYLDNGATSQKPEAVIAAVSDYYQRYNSNVHRGVHALAAQATTAYEGARERLAAFINARAATEVVFTRNATEAINLVAASWGPANLQPGDEVVVSVAEHHSNLVPWQLLCQRTGARLRHVPLTPDQTQLDMQALRDLLGPRTKLVALVHVSNMLGCVLPAAEVAEAVHEVGAKLLLDCCQSLPAFPVDVQALGADWVVGGAHKMCGPTGIGMLWGRAELLEAMPPFMGGGEMIQDVFLDRSTYAPPPSRFEPGTPAIAQAVGWGAALGYLGGLGMRAVQAHEDALGAHLHRQLSAVEGVTVYGPPPGAPGGRAALCSFNVEGLHATDISTLLDQSGVAVRSGHHCTQPLHAALGISASARASPYIYNTREEIDVFIAELRSAIDFFRSMQ